MFLKRSHWDLSIGMKYFVCEKIDEIFWLEKKILSAKYFLKKLSKTFWCLSTIFEKISGISENFEKLKFARSSISEILNFQNPVFPKSGISKIMYFQNREFPKSSIFKIVNFQNPEVPKFGISKILNFKNLIMRSK